MPSNIRLLILVISEGSSPNCNPLLSELKPIDLFLFPPKTVELTCSDGIEIASK